MNTFTLRSLVVLAALAVSASAVVAAPLLSEDFNGDFPPAGWSVENLQDNGVTWGLNTDVPETNLTALVGGTGASAMVDSLGFPFTDYDAALVSPVVMLPASDSAELTFLSSLEIFSGDEVASVEVSTDGGSTWPAVLWSSQTTATSEEIVPLDDLAGQSIQVRFRYANPTSMPWDLYWQGDNVQIVPEPVTLSLLLLGLPATVVRRRRRAV